jgi:FKBP-type peptidyl-prolyl cis-trans isomerase (trigger factor)
MTKSSIEDMEKQLEGEAKKNLTYRYMIEEISKLENIDVNDKDVDKETERLAELYQMKKEELVDAFGGLDMIKYDLKIRKTIDFLKENN